MKRLWYYYIYLLIVWGCFRWFVHLPEAIEELWFKPLIWLVPLFWWNLSLTDKLPMFGKRWSLSLFSGIVVGIGYYALIKKLNFLGMSWNLDLVGVVIATAVTEELTFSGFVAGYLEKIQKGKWINLLIVGLMVAGVRLPILIFVHNLGFVNLVGVLFIAGASGVINAWIRVETGNVAGSVLARIGMNLAILG